MWSNEREIAAGDLVIVWLTREDIQPLIVTPGKELNLRFGHYRHSDLIGIPYGSKVGSRNGRGFVHLLRPTPELWTMSLPHRTQILYLADISFIVSYLNIKSGSQVVEAGTGSGSFSHSVARTIGQDGHLHSYEFHEARANKARDEFDRHGMANIVSVTHRNVCKDGFTVVDKVDSVFLDLPAPWSAVQHAKKALRKDRTTRICCFSPCMEQVLRTVSALNDAGFSDITMYETLLRPHEVNTTPRLPTAGEASARLKGAMARREEKRLLQVAASQRKRAAQKRKRETNGEDGDDQDVDEQAKGESTEAAKKLRVDNDKPEGEDSEETNVRLVPTEGGSPPAVITQPALSSSQPQIPSQIVISKVSHEVRGHTSYLTFATLEPALGTQSNAEALVATIAEPEPPQPPTDQ
ncbi:tRNA methyltransferase complex GCD14 subunit [Schizopora paradoxa]|uniref:tRNA (adenine(58)-N(1))-methyltransferase catalytic subunit TRM61 n=1 Tax=Schizopora paradoxa TaxID=27342 RepID=A0A0H2RRY5_9AGAM|nr:tRNA methyltransferase complex GCD14 subunit [Schizopora paradoxa]